MPQSKKTAAVETEKEIITVAAETAAEEKSEVSEAKTPAKRTRKTKTVETEALKSASAAEAQPPKKRGRKSCKAAEKSSEASAAEVKADTKPAAKRTRKTKTASAPEQSEFEKFVYNVKSKTAKAKAYMDFAAQVTINGKVDGIFYVKALDGAVYAEGYDYVGADLYVTADSETFTDLMNGKADFDDAVKNGKLEIVGAPLSTVIAFKNIVF